MRGYLLIIIVLISPLSIIALEVNETDEILNDFDLRRVDHNAYWVASGTPELSNQITIFHGTLFNNLTILTTIEIGGDYVELGPIILVGNIIYTGYVDNYFNNKSLNIITIEDGIVEEVVMIDGLEYAEIVDIIEYNGEIIYFFTIKEEFGKIVSYMYYQEEFILLADELSIQQVIMDKDGLVITLATKLFFSDTRDTEFEFRILKIIFNYNIEQITLYASTHSDLFEYTFTYLLDNSLYSVIKDNYTYSILSWRHGPISSVPMNSFPLSGIAGEIHTNFFIGDIDTSYIYGYSTIIILDDQNNPGIIHQYFVASVNDTGIVDYYILDDVEDIIFTELSNGTLSIISRELFGIYRILEIDSDSNSNEITFSSITVQFFLLVLIITIYVNRKRLRSFIDRRFRK